MAHEQISSVCSVSKVRARLHDRVVSEQIDLTFGRRANGCTNIPLAAGRAQEDETFLEDGVSRPRPASVRPPGSVRTD